MLGPYLQHLRPLADACGAQVLSHPAAASTLVDSQRRALEGHAAQSTGGDLLLVLADLPLLEAPDIQALLAAWRQRSASVQAQIPRVGKVRGHPVLLSWEAVLAVRATPGHAGIRDWLAGHPEAIRFMDCERLAYVTDLDTPADLEALRAWFHPQPVDWPPEVLAAGQQQAPVAGVRGPCGPPPELRSPCPD